MKIQYQVRKRGRIEFFDSQPELVRIDSCFTEKNIEPWGKKSLIMGLKNGTMTPRNTFIAYARKSFKPKALRVYFRIKGVGQELFKFTIHFLYRQKFVNIKYYLWSTARLNFRTATIFTVCI